jgi:hypothetical protein
VTRFQIAEYALYFKSTKVHQRASKKCYQLYSAKYMLRLMPCCSIQLSYFLKAIYRQLAYFCLSNYTLKHVSDYPVNIREREFHK